MLISPIQYSPNFGYLSINSDSSGRAFNDLSPNSTSENADRMTISQEAEELYKASKKGTGVAEDERIEGEDLNSKEKREVEKLKQRDQEVRAHEQAHLSAAGNLAIGGAHYKYQNGPDGKQYAVGGEVNLVIKDSPEPEQDLQNAHQVERAALAPAKPSAQDRNVATRARQKEAIAQKEIITDNAKELSKNAQAVKNPTENHPLKFELMV
jgi:hypothetical protein